MGTLADFRGQYPQYNDMSDDALADALYKKHYSDLPREQFDKQIGLVKTGKIPQQSQMNIGEQFGAGVERGIAGAKQLESNIFESPEQAQKVKTAIAKRDAEIAARGGLGIAGTVGEALPGIAAAAAVPFVGEGIGASMLGGAAGGAISGAIQPVTAPDYWSQKTDDMILGSAWGGAGATAVHALGSILSPNLDPAQKALVASGVNLTPGQMAGGVLRRAEEAFKSLPILGSFIRGAEGRGIEGFNRGVINQALQPIGQRLSAGTQVGPQALIEADAKLGAAYDQLLPNMRLQMDHDLAQDFLDVSKRAGELPKELADQFSTIMRNRVQPYFMAIRQGLPLKGANLPNLKEVTGNMRAFANQYRGSNRASEREMAYLFDDVRTVLDKAVQRQNPQFADQLKRIDAGWAMLARAEQAASRRATSESIFTPADLLSSIKSADKSVRKRRFAQGKSDPLLALYASYGQKVLPGKLPDSGTTERALYDAAILAAGGAAHAGAVNPLVPIGLAAGAMPYTRPGMAAINAAARGQIPGGKVAGSVVRKLAPSTGAVVGAGMTDDDSPTPYGGPQQ